MLGQQLGGPAEEARGRLVAGASQQPDVTEDLVPGQRAHRAVLVGELRGEQLGHQVVRRVLGPPFDVGGVVRRRAVLRHEVGLGHDALLEAQPLVDVVPDRLLVLLGDAEQHPDGAHGDLAAEVGDEVETAGADQRVQLAGREGADLGLDGRHAPGREDAAHEATVQLVVRRVLEDEQAWRQLRARLDDLEDRALGRAVRLPLPEAALHILVATHRVEVVLLVVIERRLVAQPLPHRVRIGVDPEVVGVVVELRRGGGHLVSSL